MKVSFLSSRHPLYIVTSQEQETKKKHLDLPHPLIPFFWIFSASKWTSPYVEVTKKKSLFHLTKLIALNATHLFPKHTHPRPLP